MNDCISTSGKSPRCFGLGHLASWDHLTDQQSQPILEHNIIMMVEGMTAPQPTLHGSSEVSVGTPILCRGQLVFFIQRNRVPRQTRITTNSIPNMIPRVHGDGTSSSENIKK